MKWLYMLAGPLVGAVIGYFTNYIAVKMLFRPRRAVKIGKWQLPLTPGIIPKRKDQLAHAIGQAVGTRLFTGNDVKRLFLSEKMKGSVADTILSSVRNDSRPLEELLLSGMGEESYEFCKVTISRRLCEKLQSGIQAMDLGTIVAQRLTSAVKQKVSGTMLAVFVHDRTIHSLADSVHSGIDQYLKEDLHEVLLPKVATEVNAFLQKNPKELCRAVTTDREELRVIIARVYESVVTAKADQVLELFHVSDVVEQKIYEMDVEEMEGLVLSVMKHELRMIVNLGALIGFLIGIVNVFVG